MGVRAELASPPAGAALVGVLCVGSVDDAAAGYGFYVDADGSFLVTREEPSGEATFLEQGRDPRIADTRRISITCVEELTGGTAITGWVDGIEIVGTTDADQVDGFDHAGIAIVPDRAGDAVTFTSVVARVPDEEWTP